MKKIVNMFANDYSTAHWQRKVSFWIIFVAIPVMIVAGDALFGKNTPGDIIVFCAAILGARKLYVKSHNFNKEDSFETRHFDSTVVFLDIDGAISPYTHRFDKEKGVSVNVPPAYDFTYYLGGLNMPLASHTVDLLQSLSANQAVWSSSRGEMSNDFNEDLEMPLFDYTMKKRPGYTKAKAMEDFLEAHPEIEEVILVEDEPYRFNHPAGVEVGVVQTDPYMGLTEEQVGAIFGMLGL